MVIRAAARPRHLTSPRIAATQIAQDVANSSKTQRATTDHPAFNVPATSRAPESIATIPKNHNRPIRTASRAIAATSSLHSVLPRSLRRSSTVVRRPPARRVLSDRECFDKETWWMCCESNSRPKTAPSRAVRAYHLVCSRVRAGPSRLPAGCSSGRSLPPAHSGYGHDARGRTQGRALRTRAPAQGRDHRRGEVGTSPSLLSLPGRGASAPAPHRGMKPGTDREPSPPA